MAVNISMVNENSAASYDWVLINTPIEQRASKRATAPSKVNLALREIYSPVSGLDTQMSENKKLKSWDKNIALLYTVNFIDDIRKI